ncbi:acetyltransferase [Novosphingobium sp. CECT 9465]|uniref:acetyltransferase n=1 Tax=Novosphingobium sp. CECT 9465 TaxID=2829794 RepID=UPI001E57CDC4|nr:acetyltransferase [Novosphingobium sp. CECT 9465]
MISLRLSRPDDAARTLAVWAAAVDATHPFLTPADRVAIGDEVAAFLPHVPLLLAVDENDCAIAFMLVADGMLEALFVDPAHHGTGIGKALVSRALADNPGMSIDVNAQNGGAVQFYRRLGFVETGRSDRDGQGRAYPLVHMRHAGCNS